MKGNVIKHTGKAMKPYSIVFMYKKRKTDNEDLFVIYDYDGNILHHTSDSYNLRIYLDIIGMRISERLGERYLLNNFNKKFAYSNMYKVVGRAYKLKKSRV